MLIVYQKLGHSDEIVQIYNKNAFNSDNEFELKFL
jgi:hypothetical protein